MPLLTVASTAFSFIVDCFVVSGVVWPYVAQTRKMQAENDPHGFDTRASLVIMVTSTLRIFYFVALPAGEKYGIALLLQAVAAVSAQLYVILCILWLLRKRAAREGLSSEASETCVSTVAGEKHVQQLGVEEEGAREVNHHESEGKEEGNSSNIPSVPSDRVDEDERVVCSHQIRRDKRVTTKSLFTSSTFNFSNFWRWSDLKSYLLAEFLFIVLCFLVTIAVSPVYPAAYAQFLGAASLGLEALLPLPQVLSHFKRRSTEGFSFTLIGAWAAGDFFKSIYAGIRREPLPFLFCGLFQLACDCVILVQMVVLYPAASAASSAPSARELEEAKGDGDAIGEQEGEQQHHSDFPATIVVHATSHRNSPAAAADTPGSHPPQSSGCCCRLHSHLTHADSNNKSCTVTTCSDSSGSDGNSNGSQSRSRCVSSSLDNSGRGGSERLHVGGGCGGDGRDDEDDSSIHCDSLSHLHLGASHSLTPARK